MKASFADAIPQWLPIDTAPKDGSFIWLGRPGRMRVGCWHQERWADAAALEVYASRRDLLFTPTHWQRLPTPLPGSGAGT